MPEIDPARLNQAEREILALLAAGHTAKSIASATGRSVNAVNERLREARRKTGVGSSRELARLLHKNGDQQIGVVAPVGGHDPAAVGRDGRVRVSKGIVMSLTAVFLSFAALASFGQIRREDTPDPMIDAAMGAPATRPESIRQRFLAERRDPAWATVTEADLRRRYAALTPVPLRVNCAATICEIAGQPAIDRKPITRFMDAVQGSAFADDLRKAGLEIATSAFGSPKGAPNTLAYAAYIERR